MSLEQTLNNTATEAFEEAYSLLLSEEDWKEAKRNELGGIVMTKKNKRGKSNQHCLRGLDIKSLWERGFKC